MFNGRKIKELRVKMGLTQSDLGKLINVTKVSISCYEKNIRIPNLETLVDLANVLNTTPNYFLGFEVPATVNEDPEEYTTYISKEDLEIIKELKKHLELYNMFCENPKRIIESINKKFN